MHFPLWLLLVSIHTLAASVWLGAMVYSLTLLHTRAKKFFHDDEQLESFIATLSQGARWKVLAALLLILLTGLALIPLSPPHPILLLIKSALLLAAIAIFYYVSWRLWPKRIFALPSESPKIRRQFQRVAITLITIAALATILGLCAHLQQPVP